jgi:predicted HAD superfamily Cof-like phosphohydrolase
MTMDLASFVRAFHRSFKLPVLDKPTIPPKDRIKLRIALLREEVDELEAALNAGDLENALKEITDIQYVLDGAYAETGLWKVKDAAFWEVHRSNMSKLGPNGMPIYREDGKVRKGPNYSPANLHLLVWEPEEQIEMDFGWQIPEGGTGSISGSPSKKTS